MTAKSIIRPWLDAAEEAKFEKGVPGVTPDRWREKPSLPPCWRGDYREWHIEDGTSYQNQVWCDYWKTFINPSGFTCELCRARTWPMIERFRAHILPGLDKEKQAAAILKAVTAGRLTEQEGIQLGEEFDLG